MSDYPEDLKYSTEHEWVRSGNGSACGWESPSTRLISWATSSSCPCQRWGMLCRPVTRAASWNQPRASRTSFARCPEWSPAVNPLLEANPETINTDPYGDGWLFELELEEGADLDDLLDADSYAEQVAG